MFCKQSRQTFQFPQKNKDSKKCRIMSTILMGSIFPLHRAVDKHIIISTSPGGHAIVSVLGVKGCFVFDKSKARWLFQRMWFISIRKSFNHPQKTDILSLKLRRIKAGNGFSPLPTLRVIQQTDKEAYNPWGSARTCGPVQGRALNISKYHAESSDIALDLKTNICVLLSVQVCVAMLRFGRV